MTSLIFWVPYTAHHVYTARKKEKQRVKNYERWEGLRDEYDEQRRTQSLDLQRTGFVGGGGAWDQSYDGNNDNNGNARSSMDGYYGNNSSRPILTLRDQQEANDARTSWRPQEAWDTPRTQLQAQMTGQVQYFPPGQGHPNVQRHASATPAVPAYMQQQQQQQQQPQYTGSTSALPLRAQKTGATWDEGLPAPLQVSRRSYDGEEYSHRYRQPGISSTPASNGVSRQNSVSRDSRSSLVANANMSSRTHTPSGLRTESTPQQQQYQQPSSSQTMQAIELPKNEFGFIEPAASNVSSVPVSSAPGGRMAELLERGY